MDAGNLPILYQNIMFGLPSDFARDVFLWAVERPGEGHMCYRAERFAREAARLVETMTPMLSMGFDVIRAQKPELFEGAQDVPDAQADLLGFVLTRQANWRYGGNVKPAYARAA